MNLKQIQWASQHDWFIKSRRTPYGTYIIVCRGSYPGEGAQTFTDFEALKAWAGY